MIDLLGKDERQTILQTWNAPAPAAELPLDAGSTLPARFGEQAARTPDAIALTCDGESLSYRALDERSNQLAHHLLVQGVAPGTIVGLCVDRSIDMLVGLLGILKTGAAYLPLDPAYPPDRLEYMLIDAGVRHLVAQSALVRRLPPSDLQIVRLDTDAAPIARRPTSTPLRHLDPQSAAYVIYTSGSTGQPKGVVVTHQNVLRLFDTHPGHVPVWLRRCLDPVSLFRLRLLRLGNLGRAAARRTPGRRPPRHQPLSGRLRPSALARRRDRPQSDAVGFLSIDGRRPRSPDVRFAQSPALRDLRRRSA